MISIIISIIILSALGVFAFFIVFNYQMQRAFHLPHKNCTKNPTDFKITYVEQLIQTKYNKKLQLWELAPNAESKTVIIGVNGWKRAVDTLLPLVSDLLEEAHIYLLSTRNHCKSDNSRFISIVSFRDDIRSAIDYVREKHGAGTKIILLGYSYGACASLYSAYGNKDVQGCILLAPFADLEEVVKLRFVENRIPAAFIENMTRFVEFRAGEEFKNVAPEKLIPQMYKPIYLVQEALVPVDGLRRRFDIKFNHANSKNYIIKNFNITEPVQSGLDIAGLRKFIAGVSAPAISTHVG